VIWLHDIYRNREDYAEIKRMIELEINDTFCQVCENGSLNMVEWLLENFTINIRHTNDHVIKRICWEYNRIYNGHEGHEQNLELNKNRLKVINYLCNLCTNYSIYFIESNLNHGHDMIVCRIDGLEYLMNPNPIH